MLVITPSTEIVLCAAIISSIFEIRFSKEAAKEQKPQHSRNKSPNSVLREAKVRLRKLEIEAEAVEKSYLEFKKRQLQEKEKRINLLNSDESVIKDVVGEIGQLINIYIFSPLFNSNVSCRNYYTCY